MPRGFVFLALFFLGHLYAADVADASRVHLTPVPEWVRREAPPDYTVVSPDGATHGVYHLLLDRQTQVEKQEAYSRTAYKITSAAGVQEASQIAFSFDPGYESLDLHTLVVWRDGQSQNRLLLEKMQLLQQERDLERHQYNGQLTALFLLEDVRVGDVIEYSYTRKGENPIFGRHYMDTQLTKWGAPILRQSIRLIAAADHPLIHQQLGGKPLSLSVRSEGAVTEYNWEAKDQKAGEFEAGAPSWYLPLSLLQVTDFVNWKEVVEWARPLYAPTPLSEPLRAKVQELISGLKTDQERVVAVLDFVQNDIRYLGMELGSRSHAPSEPDQVFRLRYGDCKDKVRLFCALLHEVGISAVPALTHSRRGKKLNDWLPSIEAFDHVIARIDVSPGSFWVDPTLTDQAGALDHRSLPNYGWALPIEAGNGGLQRVDNSSLSFAPPPFKNLPKTLPRPDPSEPLVGSLLKRAPSTTTRTELRISETFLMGEPGDAAELHVKSVFAGLAADSMRGYLRETPPEQVGKNLLNLRAKFFANLKLLENPTWSDDRSRNEITLEHRYHVPQMWRKDEKTSVLSAEVYPLILRDYAAAPETMVRTAPYAVQYPLRVVCEIELRLKKPWPVRSENQTIHDEAFDGNFSVSSTGNEVNLKYEFTTSKDEVEARRMEEFATHLHDYRETFGYLLTYNPEIAKRKASFRLNGTLVAVAALSLVVWSALGFWVYRRPWRLHAPSPEANRDLVGIEGWLILIAFGTIARPIYQAVLILRGHEKYLDLRLWEDVTANGHMALSLELVGQIGLFVLGVVTAVAFFRRRPIFPVLFVATFGALLVFQTLDGLIVANLIGWGEKQTTELIFTIIKVLAPSCIWVPYMFLSRRVKATFISGRETVNTPSEPPPLVVV